MKLRSITWVFLSIIMISACQSKKSKSDIEVLFTQDTLDVGYTYWWPESGPFIGNCGEELSLVFTGTVTNLKSPTNDPGPLYTAQEGIIELERVFKIKDLGVHNYNNQKFFSTDCFADTGVIEGDKVLVFCYDYEGEYTIPGKKSILKIDAFDNDLIDAIRTYIDTDQSAIRLKKEMKLFENYGLKENLEQLINCAEEQNSETKL